MKGNRYKSITLVRSPIRFDLFFKEKFIYKKLISDLCLILLVCTSTTSTSKTAHVCFRGCSFCGTILCTFVKNDDVKLYLYIDGPLFVSINCKRIPKKKQFN